MLPLLLHASPDVALMLAVAGILLIFVELNRPGVVLPGALGLLLFLLAAAALSSFPWNAVGAWLLAASFVVQLVGVRRDFSTLGAIATGLGFFGGCRFLLATADGSRIHLSEAILAGLLLGPGTSVLTAIARRARTNKGLDL